VLDGLHAIPTAGSALPSPVKLKGIVILAESAIAGMAGQGGCGNGGEARMRVNRED